MSKTIKILLIFTLLFSIFVNVTFATNTAENNLSATDTATTETEEQEETTQDDTEASTTSTFNNSGITSVSQLSNYSEANLELNNILNIILIAIGILIILFAIAILIRLKS